MGTVTKIMESQGALLVETLEYLLVEARGGRIQGFVYASRQEDNETEYGIFGALRNDPAVLAVTASRIAYKANEMMEQQSKRKRTRKPARVIPMPERMAPLCSHDKCSGCSLMQGTVSK